MRYIKLTINGTTYHPEVNRAARRLYWLTGGALVTNEDDTRKLVQDWGW